MERHIAVPEYFLDMVAEKLPEDFKQMYAVEWLQKNGTRVPCDVLPHCSKGDLLEQEGLKDVSGIDCALPQRFVDNIMEKMNFNICPHFAMDCRSSSYKLIPLTIVGKAMLPVIEKVMFNK